MSIITVLVRVLFMLLILLSRVLLSFYYLELGANVCWILLVIVIIEFSKTGDNSIKFYCNHGPILDSTRYIS